LAKEFQLTGLMQSGFLSGEQVPPSLTLTLTLTLCSPASSPANRCHPLLSSPLPPISPVLSSYPITSYHIPSHPISSHAQGPMKLGEIIGRLKQIYTDKVSSVSALTLKPSHPHTLIPSNPPADQTTHRRCRRSRAHALSVLCHPCTCKRCRRSLRGPSVYAHSRTLSARCRLA
jgi:hypothetical protein